MASIIKITQILVLKAGTSAPQAVFELLTDHPTPKRLLAVKNGTVDSNVYHVNRLAAEAWGIWSADALNLYENTWPVDVIPALGANGELNSGFASSFLNADYGIGSVGVVTLNGYNLKTAGFNSNILGTETPKVPFANTNTNIGEIQTPFVDQPVVKAIGWGALAALGATILAFIIKKLVD